GGDVPESARSGSGIAVRNQDPRNARRAAQSAQDADCACAPGHRVYRLHDSAGAAPAPSAGDADQVERAPRRAVRVSDAEVDRPVQGHGPPEDATSHSALDRGADPRTQSCDSRVGRVLQTRSRAETLSPARWLGGATLWSHRFRRWRCPGWKVLPTSRLRGELGLVSLIGLIPSLTPRPRVALS